MKVIIAGSRNLENYLLVAQAMQRCGYDVTEVVCGCATGVDTLGERWARTNNIPVKEMPANWNIIRSYRDWESGWTNSQP